MILLIVLLLGLGGIVYWQFGDKLLGLLNISTGGAGSTVDTTAPVISEAKSTVNVGGIIITWVTDEPSSSQVEYGKNIDAYTDVFPAQPADDPSTGQSLGVVDHSVTLSGASLEQEVTYHYRVKSTNAAGLETVSPDKTFTTIKPPE
ncbi:MAG: fibronectin type III domain-containing protein [Dehalococcoidia bacterium]